MPLGSEMASVVGATGLADPLEHELKARTPVQQPEQRMDHYARRALKTNATNLVDKHLDRKSVV